MKKNLSLAILFLCAVVAIFYMSGCATVPSVTRFPYETIRMNNYPYFALVDMCDEIGVQWDYDPLSKEIVLKKGTIELKMLVGSKNILVDSVFHELPKAVEIRESVIYAPVDLRKYFVSQKGCRMPLKNLSPDGFFLRPVDTVIIDAGHGGIDPGAIGRFGLKEKIVVLDIAEKVAQELKCCGIKVYLTRSDDEFIPLSLRSNVANKKKADLFVSIHANANHSRKIEGLEAYYLTEAVDDSARALFAAQNYPLEMTGQDIGRQSPTLKAIVWDMIYSENRKESVALARAISDVVTKKMELRLIAIKGAPFVVLKGTRMPSVLIEIGYLSNKEGEKKLSDPAYRQQMAESIAEGIVNFKNYAEGRV